MSLGVNSFINGWVYEDGVMYIFKKFGKGRDGWDSLRGE